MAGQFAAESCKLSSYCGSCAAPQERALLGLEFWEALISAMRLMSFLNFGA